MLAPIIPRQPVERPPANITLPTPPHRPSSRPARGVSRVRKRSGGAFSRRTHDPQGSGRTAHFAPASCRRHAFGVTGGAGANRIANDQGRRSIAGNPPANCPPANSRNVPQPRLGCAFIAPPSANRRAVVRADTRATLRFAPTPPIAHPSPVPRQCRARPHPGGSPSAPRAAARAAARSGGIAAARRLIAERRDLQNHPLVLTRQAPGAVPPRASPRRPGGKGAGHGV